MYGSSRIVFTSGEILAIYSIYIYTNSAKRFQNHGLFDSRIMFIECFPLFWIIFISVDSMKRIKAYAGHKNKDTLNLQKAFTATFIYIYILCSNFCAVWFIFSNAFWYIDRVTHFRFIFINKNSKNLI